MAKPEKKKATAMELDVKFDSDEDITEYLDLDSGIKRVSVDFPLWMIGVLDAEAKRLGVSRQFVIKQWVDDKIRDRGLMKKETA